MSRTMIQLVQEIALDSIDIGQKKENGDYWRPSIGDLRKQPIHNSDSTSTNSSAPDSGDWELSESLDDASQSKREE